MTRRVDAGSIVCQESLAIDRYGTLDSAIRGAYDLAARVVPEAIRRAMTWDGCREWTGPLPPANGWPTAEEIAAFRARGFRLV